MLTLRRHHGSIGFHLLLFLLSLCITTAIHAQFGVYGKFDYTHFNNDTSSGAPNSFTGGGLGVYDDFLHAGPVHAGVDLRGDLSAANNYQYRSGLVGIRVGVKAPILPIRPYVQGSIGVGGPKYTGATAAGITAHFNNKLLYEVLGGLDYTLLPHVDFRVLEVGVGRQSSAGSGSSSPTSTSLLLSSGLVIRL